MTESHKLKMAQLGAGYWGPNLIRNFMQLGRIDEFHVGDPDQARLDKIRRQYPNIRTTTDSEALINDPSLEAMVLALPASLHYEYARKALLAGKHVLVEKPLAMKAVEAEELVELSDQKGKVLMVGHTFLYNSAVLKVKELIDSGELGQVYYIVARRLNLGRVRQDVNALWNLAPHDISIILFWLGESPSRINAEGLTFLQDGIEDVVFINLVFPSGRAAHIHVSWLDPVKTRKIVVVGSKKMVLYDDVSSDSKIMIYDKGIDRKNIIRQLPDIESFGQFQLIQRAGDVLIPKIDHEEPLRVECQHFIDCVRGNSAPRSDGRSGRQVVEIMEKVDGLLKKAAG